MKFEMTKKPISVFSFSSLTDIVMLLLIFFMLTSQFVVQTGVKVKLPGAKNNEQTIPSKWVVSITKSNKIYIGKKQVELRSLASELSKSAKKNKIENLIIRADKRVSVDILIKVIDSAKSVGIIKFTIETEKKSI